MSRYGTGEYCGNAPSVSTRRQRAIATHLYKPFPATFHDSGKDNHAYISCAYVRHEIGQQSANNRPTIGQQSAVNRPSIPRKTPLITEKDKCKGYSYGSMARNNKLMPDEIVPILVQYAKARNVREASIFSKLSTSKIIWTILRAYPYREELKPYLKAEGLTDLQIRQLWEPAERKDRETRPILPARPELLTMEEKELVAQCIRNTFQPVNARTRPPHKSRY